MSSRILRDAKSGMLVDLGGSPEIHPTGLDQALKGMVNLESGTMANADEQRQVGHYWLRDPERAPDDRTKNAIEACQADIRKLSRGEHDTLLWIGIGGSALGPQLLHRALRRSDDPLTVHFLDNVDPHGIQQTLNRVVPQRTLIVVVSKSGGTVETRCAMEVTQSWWEKHGEPFAPHAIAITAAGSVLDQRAKNEGWKATLPVWDWVGGRTSITGAVGQVLMQLCGWDPTELLAGARDADRWCRSEPAENPAARVAALLHQSTQSGIHGLVVEPYSDALSLLARYLQQLVMESIGKEVDRTGRLTRSGILVLGNKGATDQHALMQQILDGRTDALCCFVDIAERDPTMVDARGRPLADHLLGMLEGTRTALRERGRPTLLIRIPAADAYGLGLIIALFERIVGIWAELLDINAYHQPAVESGKKAARDSLELMDRITEVLTDSPVNSLAIAEQLGADDHLCWRLLHHLAATSRARVLCGSSPDLDRFHRIADHEN